MRRSILFLLIAGIAIFNCSCQKDEEIKLDKQIVLSFGGSYFGSLITTGDTLWRYLDVPDYKLVNFDKRNYSGIKSVVFAGPISSEDSSNYCIVELFNLTDSLPIMGSTIMTNIESYEYTFSENILTSLPDKNINIGIRLKSSKNSIPESSPCILYSRLYLFLNR
jgi:hypothetical protein